MFFGKAIKAAIITLLIYLVGTVAVAPAQALIPQSSSQALTSVSGVAYAADPQTQQEICNDYKDKQSQLDACKDGFTAASRGEARTDTCDPLNGGQKTACLTGFNGYMDEGRGSPDDGAGDLGVADNGNPPECNNGAFSWFICSAMEWIQGVVTFVEQNAIAPLLDTPSLSFEGPLFEIWKVMVGIADVSFVLVFLVLIFANTVGYNIKAYHVRQMIPKLVAAAILVQASYLLAALAVDVSNVLGRGIFDLISGLIPEFSGDITAGETAATYGIGLAGATVAVMGLAGSIASGTIFLVMIGAVVGVFVTFLTLVLRQVLLALLIITMPLAMVAWVLPNTKEFAEEWSELFIKLLLMYPFIMLFFAAGKIFAVAASAAADTNAMGPVLALVGLAAPLFLIPVTFNFAGTLFKSSRNLLLKAAGKAHSGLNDKIKDSRPMKEYQERQLNRANVRATQLNDKLADWGKNRSGLQGFIGRHPGLAMTGAAYAMGNPKVGNHLERSRAVQGEIGKFIKELEDLGMDKNSQGLVAIMKGDKDALNNRFPQLRKYAETELGVATAGRLLLKGDFNDDYEKVRRSYIQNIANIGQPLSTDAFNKGKAVPSQAAAERVFSQNISGAGGAVFGNDPLLGRSKLSGDEPVGADVIAKFRPNVIAKYMKTGDAAKRLAGYDTESSRYDGDFKLRGGSVFHLDPTAVKQTLSNNRILTDTTIEGRSEFRRGYVGAAADARRTQAVQAYNNHVAGIGALTDPEERRKAIQQAHRMHDGIRHYDDIKNYVQTRLNADGTVN